MKRSILTVVIVLAVALAASSPRIAEAASCTDILGNNMYACHVKSDFGTDFFDCFQFFTPGTQSLKFDLSVAGLLDVLSCTCDAGGGFKNPQFNADKDFQCVTPGISDLGITFNGKATPHKIEKMQAVNEFGDAFVIECVLDAACLEPLRPQDAGNPYKQ